MASSGTLLSTACFPPLEYMVHLLKGEKIVVDIHETYPKQTWRNRFTILSGNGPVSLTIPIEKPYGNQTQTHQVVISDHAPWQKGHWTSILSAYRNAPFFLYYSDLVHELIVKDTPKLLWAFNDRILQSFCKEWGMDYPIEYTRNFVSVKNEYLDLRFTISPKARERKGLEIPAFIPYYQVFSDRYGFCPNASILDLVFNLGPDTIDYLMSV